MDDDRYDAQGPRPSDRYRRDADPSPDEPADDAPYRRGGFAPDERPPDEAVDIDPYDDEAYRRPPSDAASDAQEPDVHARERYAPRAVDPAAGAPYDRTALRRADYRRGGSATWPLVAGAAAVVLLGLVAGLLLFNDSGDGVAGSPTPSPSLAASGDAESPVVSASATAAAAGPVVSPPEGFYPPGAVVRAAVDLLRIRVEPGTGAAQVTNVPLGGHLYITDLASALGPVERDGLSWYPVEYAGGDDVWPIAGASPTELSVGWVAAGQGGEQFLELVPVTCAGGDLDLRTLASMTPWERLACLSGRPLSAEGISECCGSTQPGLYEPEWLVSQSKALFLAVPDELDVGVAFHARPELFDEIPEGTIIRAQLHVDDAEAGTCHIALEVDGAAVRVDPEVTVFYCRERLVLDAFE